jgi:putative transposase
MLGKMNNQSVRLLAYVTGLVNQELLLQSEYLVAENHILKAHLRPGFRLTESERITLAEIGKRLGRKALQKVTHIAKPDTLLAWYRRIIAHKFDGSKQRRSVGRPRIHTELENLVVRLARENSDWGYDRIVGALANLGHLLSDQTVGNILRRHGIPPAPKRSQTTTWKEFIRRHMDVLSGTDFFTHLERLGDVLRAVFPSSGEPASHHRRDQRTPGPELDAADRPERHAGALGLFASLPLRLARSRHEVQRFVPEHFSDRRCEVPGATPPESKLNAFVERWVRSVRDECLSKLTLFGESSLRRALTLFTEHYHSERNHQGKGNVLLFPDAGEFRPTCGQSIQCRERLGGLLKYYYPRVA